jgi:hypothetical protein
MQTSEYKRDQFIHNNNNNNNDVFFKSMGPQINFWVASSIWHHFSDPMKVSCLKLPGFQSLPWELRQYKSQTETLGQLTTITEHSEQLRNLQLMPSESWDFLTDLGCIVAIMISYGLDDRGVGVWVPVGSKIVSTSSRPALGSTQPPIQWVTGALSPGVKRPGREADH